MFTRNRAFVPALRWRVAAFLAILAGVVLLATACASPVAGAPHPTSAASGVPTAAPAAVAPTMSPTTAPTAAAPKAYIGLFKDNAVAVLDTGSNRVLSKIPIAAGPHGLVVTPDGKWVYASSDGDSTVSVIDTSTDQVARTIEVGKMPHGLAITPDGRQVLVAVFGTSMVAFIDTSSQQVVGQVPVPNPHNIAITPDGQTAYVAAQMPGALALAILDVKTRKQTGSVPLDKTPRALSWSPDGKQLYFTQAGVDAVQVLDPAANKIVAQIPVGASPHHPLFTPDGKLALVVSQGPGELDLLDPSSRAEIAPLQVGKQPHWIALAGSGQFAYVTNEGSNDVSVVDLAKQAVIATVPVGNAPRKIVIQPGRTTSERTGSAVAIRAYAFSPQTLTVSAGQTISWANQDAVNHTVTSADGKWDSGDIAPGGSFSLTLSQPGTYAYHCSDHPFMQGVIVVTG